MALPPPIWVEMRHFTGFWSGSNYPQGWGTRPFLGALKSKGFKAGEVVKNRGGHPRHTHDPGSQQEPHAKLASPSQPLYILRAYFFSLVLTNPQEEETLTQLKQMVRLGDRTHFINQAYGDCTNATQTPTATQPHRPLPFCAGGRDRRSQLRQFFRSRRRGLS